MTLHRGRRLVMPCLIAMLATVMLCAGTALAQEATGDPPKEATGETTPATPPAPAAGDAEAAKPETIAAADIAPQAEAMSARLREIGKLAETTQGTSDVAENLPDTAGEISRLTGTLADAPPVSLRGVLAARQHWTGLDDQLGGWQADLQKRTASLQKAHDELKASGALWQATRSDDLPETVLQQIDAVLSGIETGTTAVTERMEAVLTVQGDVSKQRDATSKALGRLDEIEGSQRSNLLVRDQDPLWRALTGEERDLSSEIAASRATIAATLREFVARYKTNFAVHGALFIVLLILIWMTRSAVSAGAMSDQEVEHVSVVLARPFSTALLVSIVLMRFIYPVASAEILQIGRLILLAPMLRLLPQLMPKFRWMFAILAAVYVVETVAQLAVEGSLVQRLLMLVTTTLAIAALGQGLIKTFRQQIFERAGTQRLVRFLCWVGVLGLVLSLVANIVGTMALSSLLANAMFNAIWTAVVLRVALNVISGLLILTLRSPLARTLPSVRGSSEIIHRRTMSAAYLIGTVTWVALVLRWLQIAQPIFAWCRTAVDYEWTVGTLQINVAGVASFIIAIVIALVLSRLVRFFLEEDVLSRLRLPRGAPATISTLVHYTIVAIGILVALAASGMDLSKLGFVVGALGVGIGFGLQNVVNNFVSGLILIFERPIKVGDLIELEATKGFVTRIGARSSTMKTFDGAEVIVPNGTLISTSVTNWTLSTQERRDEVLIPVPIEADTHQVMEVLLAVARDHKDVLEDPAPFAAFDSFHEQGIMCVLRFWPSTAADRVQTKTTIVATALEALRAVGIEVPRPQREVYLRRDAGQGDGGSKG